MNFVEDNNLACEVFFTDEFLAIRLVDGREVRVPLSLYPSLRHAPPAAREQYEMLGDGESIYWPALDLDLTVAGIVGGQPERFPAPPYRPHATRSVFVYRVGSGWCVAAKLNYDHVSVHTDRFQALRQAAEWAQAGEVGEITLETSDGSRQVIPTARAAGAGKDGA